MEPKLLVFTGKESAKCVTLSEKIFSKSKQCSSWMNLHASDRRNFSGKCAVFGQLLVRESHSENQNSMYKQYRASPFWHAVVHIYVVQI